MSAKRDYYEILGINKNVTADEIKKAYRSMALKYHPDRVTPDKKKAAEEQFKEISEAYAVLSDEKKKVLYDQYGHAGIDQKYSYEDIFRGADFSSISENAGFDFESILEHVFGGMGSDVFGGSRSTGYARRRARGRDLQIEVDISLEDAAYGVTKSVKVGRYEICQLCHGSGAKPGTKKKTCSKCDGQGQVVVSGGFFRMAQTCPQCRGEGSIISAYCPDCQGEGRVKKVHKLEVKITAGVDTGSHLRLRGEGEAGTQSRGNLHIIINVLEHPKFSRQNNDIVCEVKIGMIEAALGAEVEVPTLDGSAKMKIPAGTQSDSVFRLRGKGIPDMHSYAKGDELVRVKVEIPVNLDAQQRKLLEEFGRLSGEKTNNSSFTEKIKRAFK